MSLASDLVARTKAYLYSGFSEELNRLSSGVTSGATTLSFTYTLAGIVPGSVVSVDLEEIQVFATDSTTKQITDAVRGANGTTATSHSANAVVTVKPKFSDFRVLQAINEDLQELSGPSLGLYQLKTVDLTFSPVKFGYDLTGVTDLLDIAEVRYRVPGPAKTWPIITNFEVVRNHSGIAPSGYNDFASGFGLVIYEAGFPGLPIRVKYRAPYGTLTTLADDVLTVAGVPVRAQDIPPLGAALRLMGGRDVKRSFVESQGEPRRAEEVPPGSGGQAMRPLAALRVERVNAERSRLQKDYPSRMGGLSVRD